MAHAQKPDFVFRRNGPVHLNRRGRQFSRLMAAEVCASAVIMLDTPYSEVVWSVLATHSIRQFPLHFPSRASPCAITFQLESTVSVIFSGRDSRAAFSPHCTLILKFCWRWSKERAFPPTWRAPTLYADWKVFQSACTVLSPPFVFPHKIGNWLLEFV